MFALILMSTTAALPNEPIAGKRNLPQAAVCVRPAKTACPCGVACPCPSGACPTSCPAPEAKAAPVEYRQVCENGVCRLVPATGTPQTIALPSATGSACVGGQCAAPSDGWYLGKNLGRRR